MHFYCVKKDGQSRTIEEKVLYLPQMRNTKIIL